MLRLTRLNGHPLIVNADLIKFVEATPDTTISLVTGEKLIVRESCEDVVAATADWRQRILASPMLFREAALNAAVAAETPHLLSAENE